MNADEFNALLKGELVNNEFYKKYYQDDYIKIENELLEDIIVKDIKNCPYHILLKKH
jgi:hypothetical protein